MEIIFRLIELLIKALMDGTDAKKAAAPRSLPNAQVPAPRNAARAAPPNGMPTPDPGYDDEGWRRVATVLGLIVLVIIVGAWILYTQGWLSSG